VDQLTYVVAIALITYVCGAITKSFIGTIPNKYIPMQNVIIGVLSGLVCYFVPAFNMTGTLLSDVVMCMLTSCGVNGLHQLSKIKEEE
jgi:RsiW-degrading membrane proteinase PrsW (M82 family)